MVVAAEEASPRCPGTAEHSFAADYDNSSPTLESSDMARKTRDSRRIGASMISSSSMVVASPASPSSLSSSTSKSYAKCIQSAKHHHDHRASTSSTASTSSNSTRTSDVSSASNQYDDAHHALARHEPSKRRRSPQETFDQLDLHQQHQLLEEDPDYLPIDSTQYKRAVTKKKKKRSRRIKLKLYGLAKQAAKMNNLSGFLLHSITPRESSILNYTSMATPGTHTEYDIVVENFRTGMIWQISRRYSTFRLLREELLRPFQVPHCHYCASIMRDMQKLEPHFPGKRLWGSTNPSVVKGRAERFQKYLRGVLDIATSTYKLNCRLVSNYFVVQLRNFLTSESVRYKGIPGEFGHQIPCLLRELSVPRSPHDQMTLQTIQEHSSRGSRGSLFDDLDEADLRDFQEKLRIAEEHDRHYMDAVGGQDDDNQLGGGGGGFEDYFREEDEDEESDDDDDDEQEENEQDHQHRGRDYQL